VPAEVYIKFTVFCAAVARRAPAEVYIKFTVSAVFPRIASAVGGGS
jgi:hypothetical protein